MMKEIIIDQIRAARKRRRVTKPMRGGGDGEV